ncbi:MAG: translation initiation factor IF-2 [Candidatus Hydrogenedentota bacterium]
MQTIASVAERLDMSAEEAVERLRYVFVEVTGVDSEISDEEFDLLIDIDDKPSVADEVRNKKLANQEKAKLAEEKKKATAEKKKVAAAKKKATAAKKKAAAAKKKKNVTKKKTTKSKDSDEKTPAVAELLEPKPTDEEVTPAPQVAEILPDVAEILPDVDSTSESAPTIVIGTAIEHEEHHAEVVRADGTHIDVQDVDIAEITRDASLDGTTETEEVSANVSGVAPDPKVVEEVIRRANATTDNKPRKKKKDKPADPQDAMTAGANRPKPSRNAARGPMAAGLRKTGKTARKRQKKIERMRQEEEMRRSAAAAVREYQSGAMDGGTKKKKKKKSTGEGVEFEATPIIQVDESLTVEALANAMEVDTTDIILELMERNIMATKNQTMSMDLIRQIAEPQGFEVVALIPEEEEVVAEEPDDPDSLLPRAPVITVMGHVDHGKTSLLDQVRKASVAEGESGGITQHIAAYEVKLPQGKVVFLDTPGHEAFTAMRARGAQITDVVVLVVAADDGLMPQTVEAIDHAKAADVPIVVAVNKCDKPDAQPERIRQELSNHDLLDEQWGGKTIIKDISALNGDGIEELTELLVLETELLELKANPNKPARGAVIESEITRGQGPVAWVLVQTGTLKVGDVFLCGETYGRVRALQNTAGESVDSAGPSTPVVVTGFNAPANAGDQFLIVKDEKTARSIADKRTHQAKLRSGSPGQHITLEDFYAQLVAGEQTQLNVLVKADVQGSVDVLKSTLPDIGNEEVAINIVHSGVGAINESDILLASASDAVILGFHTEVSPKAEGLAQSEGVDIRTYRVIYEMVDDLRKSLEGMLTPDEHEVITGHAEIRAIFKSSALGSIAGCMQLDGETKRDAMARLKRGDEVVYTGKIDSVRREREQVSAVQTGFECGIKLQGFDGIAEGDIIETYFVELVAKTLA